MRLPKLLTALVVVLMAAGMIAAATLNTGHGGRPGRGVALAADVEPATTVPAPAMAPDGLSALTGNLAPSSANAPARSLQEPAAQVPLPGQTPASSPGSAASATAPAATTTAIRTALPVPTVQTLPKVTARRTLQEADAVALLPGSLTAKELGSLHHLSGVAAIEVVDTGTVTFSGAPAVAFGVDPDTFRNFTPAASANSNQLWQYLAGGSLISSYEMASDRSLKLGSELPIAPSGSSDQSVEGWLGAFASVGLPGVDLLVSHAYADTLGLTPDSGLVVSAPNLAGSTLDSELKAALPGAAVELLHATQVPDLVAGNSLSPGMRATIVAAALSRVGLPYVWGAVGPNTFDCSGLVQWSFRQAGILMPRVAAEQYLTGDHIPLADAQPGDLLFWTFDPNDPGYVDHTAIYLGNGMMVEAPHTGDVVKVIPVPLNDFAGAVEVVLRGN